MAITVRHGPGAGVIGALAVRAGATGRAREGDRGFAETQRSITDLGVERSRAISQIISASARNVGRRVVAEPTAEGKNKARRRELQNLFLTENAQRVARESTLSENEKQIAMTELNRRNRLLERREDTPQEAFEKAIVTDSNGAKFFRTNSGEYKLLDTGGKTQASQDFGKALKTARKNLEAKANEADSIAGGSGRLFEFNFTSNDLIAETETVLKQAVQDVAILDILQSLQEEGQEQEPRQQLMELISSRQLDPQARRLEGPQERPQASPIEFVDDQGRRPSEAAKADPLALPAPKGKAKTRDRVIDLTALNSDQVQAEFKDMDPSERKEFLDQIDPEELLTFRLGLPKVQRRAVENALARLDEEKHRVNKSQRRIRAAEKNLDRVLFRFDKEQKKKSKGALKTVRESRVL